jgi:hypothetical protein
MLGRERVDYFAYYSINTIIILLQQRQIPLNAILPIGAVGLSPVFLSIVLAGLWRSLLRIFFSPAVCHRVRTRAAEKAFPRLYFIAPSIPTEQSARFMGRALRPGIDACLT